MKKQLFGIILGICMVLCLSLVFVSAEDYGITICGTAVTDSNASDVFGDGTVSYDASTQTLTLKNADFAYYGLSAIYAEHDLTISLDGDSTVTAVAGKGKSPRGAIHVNDGELTITGEGSLNVSYSGGEAEKYASGIYASADITITGGANVTATGGTIAGSKDFFCYSLGVHSGGNITVSGAATKLTAIGGTITGGAGDTSYIAGIYAQKNITITDGANVTATGGEAEKSNGVRMIRGNELTIESGYAEFTGGATGIYYVNEGERIVKGENIAEIRYNDGKTVIFCKREDISGITVTVSPLTYTGEAQSPIYSISIDGETLVEGKDYEIAADSITSATDAGSYTITLNGIGSSYEGTFIVSWSIVGAPVEDEPTEDEPTEDEPTEDEPAEDDEPTEDDKPTEDEKEDFVPFITPPRYTIRATANEDGSISNSGVNRFLYGMRKTFTITPNDGYVISDVLVDGKSVGAVESYTFRSIVGDHTIEAFFEEVE